MAKSKQIIKKILIPEEAFKFTQKEIDTINFVAEIAHIKAERPLVLLGLIDCLIDQLEADKVLDRKLILTLLRRSYSQKKI